MEIERGVDALGVLIGIKSRCGSQNDQPGGAGGQDGSGVHPNGGFQPAGGAGHPGGGLNRGAGEPDMDVIIEDWAGTGGENNRCCLPSANDSAESP